MTAMQGIQRKGHEPLDSYICVEIPISELLVVLQGVVVALKASKHHAEAAARWLALDAGANAEPLSPPVTANEAASTTWESLSQRLFQGDEIDQRFECVEVRQLVNITATVSVLREASRASLKIPGNELERAWRLLHSTIKQTQQSEITFTVSRSAQGFLAVPLCSLIDQGNIQELFRLHVWMPDGQRGVEEFAIHSHQPFAQSWILAGVGTDRRYDVEPVTSESEATHAEYALAWNDGKTQDKAYKTVQVSSTVENTHRYVRSKQTELEVHVKNDSYSIPVSNFHSSDVEPDTIHASLFFFDSRRGFDVNAGILGPKDVESFTQMRNSAGVTAESLADIVQLVRSHELLMQQGGQHASHVELELALKQFDVALNLLNSADVPANLDTLRQQTLLAFGIVNRRLGRYVTAKTYLEEALQSAKPSQVKVKISGELAVVYRHMFLLQEAQRACQIEYDTALQLGLFAGQVRAIGTLGMIDYQLFLQTGDERLLQLAIEQLNERVKGARSITESIMTKHPDREIWTRKAIQSIKWELIGLSRLSLCYTAMGNLEEAQASAWKSLNLTYTINDPTDMAMSSFFYGRTLLKSGQLTKALEYLSASEGSSPAVMLCQEPSEEHRGYLQELVDAGADIDHVDQQGYTPLDYAIFSGDDEARDIVITGLRRVLSGDVEQEITQRQQQARVRKAYRELFQEQLRPALLKGGDTVFQTLRAFYAQALASDSAKKGLFDEFKFVWYRDFLQFGHLPRSTDGITNKYLNDTGEDPESAPEVIVFFSYRWINHEPTAPFPDDSDNTQYLRAITAVEKYLKIRPEVDRQRLGIWMDFACVDQDDPAAGVLALPLNLAQCNVIISLTDEEYESRAWCSVEALLAQTLRDSYGYHVWYTQTETGTRADGTKEYQLQEGRYDETVPISKKVLRFEEKDRPKVVFLERQRYLLKND